MDAGAMIQRWEDRGLTCSILIWLDPECSECEYKKSSIPGSSLHFEYKLRSLLEWVRNIHDAKD